MSTPRDGAAHDHLDRPNHLSGPSPHMVLIVEDEEPIATAIAVVVEDAGYVPVLASNGQGALSVADTRRPALVLTDLMMPRMDGIQLIAALREQAEANGYAMPPVILMTAGGPRRAREAGADAILWKPFDIEQLEKLLTRFLPTPEPQR